MSRLIPRFSATRAVRDYTDERYLPAAAAYRAGTASECAGAKAEVSRQTEWRMKRDSICFDRVTVDTVDNEHAIVASIFPGDAGPETVRVELYDNGLNGGAAVRQEMTRVRTREIDRGAHMYCATVPSDRPASDYTPRIIPHRVGLSVPLEAGWIL